MEQRNEILGALQTVLGRVPGLAVVHSSLASLVPRVGVTRWDFLYAVRSLVDRGWTLAFPAFTFSFCRNGVYDPRSSASETGLLADWVLTDLIGARRTDHPIYSFVVLGAQADAFDAFASQTTFGDDSPFALFEQKNAHVVMLGSDWKNATPFHRYEEKAEVPYRKFKTFEGNVLLPTEAIPASAVMYVRDLEIGAENDFAPLVKRLRSEDKIVKVSLWRCFVEATTMQAIRESAAAMLSDDPLVFVKNAAEVRYRLEARAEAKRLAPYRVALLGMSNLDIAATQLDKSLSQFIPDRRFEIYVSPFGQLPQQVLQRGSQLVSFDPELTIFADRLEDLLGNASPDLVESETVLESVRQHAGLIRHFVQHNGGTVLLHRFALMGRYSVEDTAVLSALLTECNSILDQAISDLDNIFLIDMAAEHAQGVPVQDPRLWHLGRIPFSDPFTRRLVERWAGSVLALLGKTSRLLVLDLDNTLWGGVLGEDGEMGISIGGDFPGNAFLRFQKTLKALSDRGIALAICSNNDEDLALDVLAGNENMVIRPDDFVAHRINWQPKWINIREIAAELDLGLSSIMFIDDNPVERESVKRNLPMVKVLELPQDPTAYTDALLTSPFIEAFRSGREDRKRIASYKARRKINLDRQSAASLEDFLHELKMELHIQPLNNGNVDRAAELCHKTNQFNTTARRYTTRDLKRMASEGMDVAVIGLQDRLTEMENIGLILLRPAASCLDIGHVDLFLLSCRVLGRTVEQAVLTWAMTHAARRGWHSLHGEIVETPRNRPVRSVFADNGYEAGPAKGLWQKITLHEPPPDWFDITDDFSKGRD